MPTLFVGSIAVGLILTGHVPTTAAAEPVAIIAAMTGLTLTIATIWAASFDGGTVTKILGVLAGFWVTYAALVIGLSHPWFARADEAGVRAQGLFLLAWLVILGGLATRRAVRSPYVFSAPCCRMDLALVAVLVGTVSGSASWLILGGLLILFFGAVGVYLHLALPARSPRDCRRQPS